MTIEFKHVNKSYEKIHALEDISFLIKKGEFVSFIGPSGEGKSTILKIIAGIEKETSGTVIRPEKIGMVFQTIALFPWLNVYENVALGLRSKKIPEKEIHLIVHKYIKMMKLENFVTHRPADLSGGQRQRVGIARALAIDPEVLLLDEPFSALDPKITAELHDDIISIWRNTGKTIVLVSHLIEEAVSMTEKIFLIKGNRLTNTFLIDLPYPRREHGRFMEEVSKIRREFFK